MITFSQLGQWGRLGNQLFEVATTIGLALKNNDFYGFPKWNYSNFCNLKDCYFDNLNISNIYQEPFFHYKEIPYNQSLDLRGFFQSYKYFDDYRYFILDALVPNMQIEPETDLCGIHVRRGDYTNLQDCYQQLDINYYNQAMEEIKSDKYIIFSDDIEWCKKHFIGSKFEFSEGKQPHEDLAIMAKRCDNMIIANSSFSWWGAYLNTNFGKKIIAPKKWFGPKLPHNTKDLIPDNWIKI
jgi:hypothetical protein